MIQVQCFLSPYLRKMENATAPQRSSSGGTRTNVLHMKSHQSESIFRRDVQH